MRSWHFSSTVNSDADFTGSCSDVVHFYSSWLFEYVHLAFHCRTNSVTNGEVFLYFSMPTAALLIFHTKVLVNLLSFL